MPTLPLATDFTGASIDEAQFKTATAQQREFLAGILGTSGTVAAALATLGALGSAWVSKTAAYTVLATDRGKLIGCSGTFSLSLTAAATMGDGFSFAVLNYGTGVITIDPNSTELIDGASTITLGAGESCVVLCAGGTAWRTIGRAVSNGEFRSQQVFTASGTWNKPAGLKRAKVTVVGGGGAGGSITYSDLSSGAAGGGGGGASIEWIEAATLGSSETVTVGGASGTSSFGAHCQATGGAAASGRTPGAGGIGSGGNLNIAGHPGSTADNYEDTTGNARCHASGSGGGTILGGGGAGGTPTTGAAGRAYGGGGAGGFAQSAANGVGGAGAGGVVIVEEFF